MGNFKEDKLQMLAAFRHWNRYNAREADCRVLGGGCVLTVVDKSM